MPQALKMTPALFLLMTCLNMGLTMNQWRGVLDDLTERGFNTKELRNV